MAKEGNLLVTFEPTHQDSALKEISALLKEVNEKGEPQWGYFNSTFGSVF